MESNYNLKILSLQNQLNQLNKDKLKYYNEKKQLINQITKYKENIQLIENVLFYFIKKNRNFYIKLMKIK